jgi:hypothetical protein
MRRFVWSQLGASSMAVKLTQGKPAADACACRAGKLQESTSYMRKAVRNDACMAANSGTEHFDLLPACSVTLSRPVDRRRLLEVCRYSNGLNFPMSVTLRSLHKIIPISSNLFLEKFKSRVVRLMGGGVCNTPGNYHPYLLDQNADFSGLSAYPFRV